MRLSNILLKPVISEKSVDLVTENKYAFYVDLKASKEAIKRELKKLFDVDALEIKTSILPGKKRRALGTRKFRKTSKRKKAVAFLKEGQSIDLFPKEK